MSNSAKRTPFDKGPPKPLRLKRKPSRSVVPGRCLCGDIVFEIDYPPFWAWHDHGSASRRAHGAAYATYIGCWRKHFRFRRGAAKLRRYEDKATGATRSFCARCGTPVLYERRSSPHMVNIPRALFEARTGREPRYHLNIAELQEWTWRGEPLTPLKGYPGVVWARPKSGRRRALGDPDF